MRIADALAWTGVVVWMLALLGCTPTTDSEPGEIHAGPAANNSDQAAGGPPLLVVDTSTPLLLEEPDKGQGASAVADTRAAAENATCLVCHGNYGAEFLVSCHAAADIGCVNCHGESLSHRSDENNTTPPQTMYSADRIDPFCQGCHVAHDVSAQKVIARWVERGLDETDPKAIVCTDCHGEHRMKVRTVIWDKKSGTLLRTNKG